MVNQDSIVCMLEPYEDGTDRENAQGKELRQIGEQSLKGNKFAVVILSGGQGSRLGSDLPKALYKLNGKCLIDHHISRIKKLIDKYECSVTLFVMVSSFTEMDIQNYFKGKDLGLPIRIIKQNDRQCLDTNGKPLRDENGNIILAPGGNGDVFKALDSVDLSEFVGLNIISVDNVLAKVLDSIFVGGFIKNDLEILSKAVKKKLNENVGVFIKSDKGLRIVEYIDLPEDQLNEYGNICNHLFSPLFIKKIAQVNLKKHLVLKKIPYFKNNEWIKPTNPNGHKIETFIFDCFKYAKKNGFMKVNRSDEFVPLKNGPESTEDNPAICEEALRKYKC